MHRVSSLGTLRFATALGIRPPAIWYAKTTYIGLCWLLQSSRRLEIALPPLQSVNSRRLAALQLAINPIASENQMKKLLLPALMAMGFTSPAWADAEKDIVQVLASCLVENAPDNWEELSVHYARNGKDDKGLNQVSVAHRVSAGGVTDRLEPCRPLIPAMLVEKLSATLPENAQQWKAVDIKIFKTGRFRVDWVQPEG